MKKSKKVTLFTEGENMNSIDQITAYEQGDLDRDATIELFQNLLDSGLVWKLQGHYGRTAERLLHMGLIHPVEKSLDKNEKV
jgi:hypothetical protein